MAEPLTHLLFQYKTCDKTGRKRMAKQVVAAALKIFTTSQENKALDEALKASIYECLENTFSSVVFEKTRLKLLLETLFYELFQKKRPTQHKTPSPLSQSALRGVDSLDTLREFVHQEITHTPQPTLDQRIQWTLYFIVTSAGACFKELADAIAKVVLSAEDPTEVVGRFHIIKVRYKKASHYSNARDENGEPVTEKLVFLTPDAVGALRGLRQCLDKHIEQKTKPQAFSLIKPLFQRAHNSGELKKLSKTQFYQYSALRLCLCPDVNMPIWLQHISDGSTHSCSMTLTSFQALATGTVKSAPLFNNRNTQLVHVERKKKTKADKGSSSYHRTPRPSDIPALSNILETTKCTITGDFCSKDELKRRLKALASHDLPLSREILVEWALYELTDRYWSKASTAHRALSAVGPAWLLACDGEDLLDLQVDDVTSLYEYILHLRKLSDGLVMSAVRSLFRFINKHYSMPLPDFLANPSHTNVVNTLPSEAHYQQLLRDMRSCFAPQTEDIQESIEVMLILLRRLFLRPFEVTGLRLMDISLEPDEPCLVRRHSNTNIKTLSAIRQLPTHLLLKPEEFKILQAYIEKRLHRVKGSQTRLLFSIDPVIDTRFSSDTFNAQITHYLSSYLGEHVPTYQLRHAGQTTLQLVLFANDETIEQLTPYSAAHATKIREWVTRGNGNDMLYQLASLAGHLSPSMTVSTYAHLSDLLLYEACSRAVTAQPLKFWQHLTGLRPSTLAKRLGMQSSGASNLIAPQDFNAALSPKKRDKTTHHQSAYCCDPMEIKKDSYSIADCETVLIEYDKAPNTFADGVEALGIDARWAALVVSAARDLKTCVNYTTQRGANSRLYPTGSTALAPPQPPSQAEKIELTRPMLQKLSALSTSSNKVTTIRRHIDYLLSHTSAGHAGVIFSCPKTLSSFLQSIRDIAPDCAKWHIQLECNTGMHAPSCARQQQMWEQATATATATAVSVNGRSTVSESKTYKNGRVTLNLLKPHVSRADLDKRGFEKMSTNALQYVAHLFEIFHRAQ